jgi:hypothetical protein
LFLGDSGIGIIQNITYENIEIHNTIWWAIFIGILFTGHNIFLTFSCFHIGTQQENQPHGGSSTPCSFFYPLAGLMKSLIINLNNTLFLSIRYFMSNRPTGNC